MIIDMNYWSKVLRKVIILAITIIGVYLGFKFAFFYMPFLIAFVLSLLLEPIIRFLMRKCKLKRKIAAILVFVIALSLIIGFIIWAVTTLISESFNLLNGLNDYIPKIGAIFQDIISKINFNKLNLSDEVVQTIQNSGLDFLSSIADYAKVLLTNVLNAITSIPAIGIYIVITFLSLYFICSDKIYMLDQMEHHFPSIWVKKIGKHIKDISKSLGCYLRAQVILVLISFCISLVGLYIFKMIGLNIQYPLLAALGISFVDALPIFGSGTVMVPWAIISAFNGDFSLGVAILVLWIIMSIIRQIVEPRIIARQIGIHPIFTLIAMYTGYKFIGILGMLIGPIILIVLKDIFASLIDKGIIKSIFERE